MTPKEKAKSLVDKMYFVISNNGQFTGEHSIPNKFAEAKKCSLIAVDEILLIQQGYAGNRDEFKTYLDYWQEVKQEIEQL
jgi:hypothetical protein